MVDLDSAGDIHGYKRRRRLAGRSDQSPRLDLAHSQGKNHEDPHNGGRSHCLVITHWFLNTLSEAYGLVSWLAPCLGSSLI